MSEQMTQLLKLRDVMKITTLGSTTIYRKMDEGSFPRPLKISPQCVRWREGDVAAWINSLPSN
jgi:prophage regulatory protein